MALYKSKPHVNNFMKHKTHNKYLPWRHKKFKIPFIHLLIFHSFIKYFCIAYICEYTVEI